MANPFDDDVDISSFYKPQSKPGKSTPQSPNEDFNFYEQQIEQILQNTVDSSNRGVFMLEESEQIGIATAQVSIFQLETLIQLSYISGFGFFRINLSFFQDLVTQGEKLQKVDRQLDEINATTKYSQRHLNNIKSVFGGIKNYFSKAPPPLPSSASKDALGQPRDTKLAGAVSRIEAQAQSDYASLGGAGVAPAGSSSLSESSRAVLAGTRWEVMNNQVDENLGSQLCSHSCTIITPYHNHNFF